MFTLKLIRQMYATTQVSIMKLMFGFKYRSYVIRNFICILLLE
jgi:hypothetical protein